MDGTAESPVGIEKYTLTLCLVSYPERGETLIIIYRALNRINAPFLGGVQEGKAVKTRGRHVPHSG